MVKGKGLRFVLAYAIILLIINLYIIIHWSISYNFWDYTYFTWIIYIIFITFYIVYSIELIISIVMMFINKFISKANIKKVIPQIIISSFYLSNSFYILFSDGYSRHLYFYAYPFGQLVILAAISLFFSHLFFTDYFKNNKIIIFWKIMSSMTSLLLLFSVFAIGAASV